MRKIQSDVSIDAIACCFQSGFAEMASISFCLESAIASGFRYSIAEMASISSRGGHARAFTYNYVKTRPEHPAPHDLSASQSEAPRSECVVLESAKCGFQSGFGEMSSISFCLESAIACGFRVGFGEMAGISFCLENVAACGFRVGIGENGGISSRGGHVRAFTYNCVKAHIEYPAPHDLLSSGGNEVCFATTPPDMEASCKIMQQSGYTGHEHLDEFELINMNGRVYDPVVARFLSPDNFVQTPFNSLGFNRYSYGFNNPLVYTDPNGENPLVLAAIIGAVAGGYSGYKIAENKGYNFGDWQTYGFIIGGAAIGGAAGYTGAALSTAGGFFANTSGIIGSSVVYSMGMTPLSSGQMAPSISFGAGSFNLGSGEFGYLGKKGNKWYQTLGYTFGAMANIQDAFAWNSGTTIDVKARKEVFGHSEFDGTYTDKTGRVHEILVSVGPNEADITKTGSHIYFSDKGMSSSLKWEMEYVKLTLKGNSSIGENVSYISPRAPQFNVSLNNVSGKLLSSMTKNLNSGKDLFGIGQLKYGLFYGCVNYTSRALLYSGVINVNAFLPITAPVLLNAELGLRNLGMLSSPFLTSF